MADWKHRLFSFSAYCPIIKQFRFNKIIRKCFSTVFTTLIPLDYKKKSLPKSDMGICLTRVKFKMAAGKMTKPVPLASTPPKSLANNFFFGWTCSLLSIFACLPYLKCILRVLGAPQGLFGFLLTFCLMIAVQCQFNALNCNFLSSLLVLSRLIEKIFSPAFGWTN